MAKGLTTRQQEILDFVLEYVDSEGYPPSIREIGSKFEIGSLRGVTVHLDALERKGYISRSNTPRSIKVVHPSFSTSSRVAMVPLIGEIAAGLPITAQEQEHDLIAVSADLVRGIDNPFLLKIKGESMIGEGILPGDLVLIKPQQTANNNDLVAVMVEDEATVKRIHFRSNVIFLMPSNPDFSPIEVPADQKVSVVGRVVGLIRDYDHRAF